jgi:N-acetyl sugar amidotransferase
MLAKKDLSINLSNREPLRNEIWNGPIRRGAFCDNLRPYQICINCVMDTTDPEIKFNIEGLCSYCIKISNFKHNKIAQSFNNVSLMKILNNIKLNRKSGQDYDCIIGLSGGIDSSYLAVKTKEWGLKPLAVHIDTGWNTNIANENITKVLNYVRTDLYTKVIDWSELRNTQVAYLKSGIANVDIPQDHLIFKTIYDISKELKIKCILSGSNYSSESVLPEEWGYDAMDGYQIKNIINIFGQDDSNHIKPMTYYDFYVNKSIVQKIQTVSPLNYITYSKNFAEKFLSTKIGWESYGEKHYESIWTKYFQGYFLPYRFGYDKRKAHYSSLILSNQISRSNALKRLSSSSLSETTLHHLENFICNKLEINSEYLEFLKNIPLSHFSDYRNQSHLKNYYALVSSKVHKLLTF